MPTIRKDGLRHEQRKPLSVRVSAEVARRARIAAAMRSTNLSDWVYDAILAQLEKEGV